MRTLSILSLARISIEASSKYNTVYSHGWFGKGKSFLKERSYFSCVVEAVKDRQRGLEVEKDPMKIMAEKIVSGGNDKAGSYRPILVHLLCQELLPQRDDLRQTLENLIEDFGEELTMEQLVNPEVFSQISQAVYDILMEMYDSDTWQDNYGIRYSTLDDLIDFGYRLNLRKHPEYFTIATEGLKLVQLFDPMTDLVQIQEQCKSMLVPQREDYQDYYNRLVQGIKACDLNEETRDIMLATAKMALEVAKERDIAAGKLGDLDFHPMIGTNLQVWNLYIDVCKAAMPAKAPVPMA